MRHLKIAVTRSVTLLALAVIFYLSAPLATPTTTGIAFKPASHEMNAVDGPATQGHAIKHSLASPFSYPGAIVPVLNSQVAPMKLLAGFTEGNQGFRIQLASATAVFKPAVTAFQSESSRPSLILPNISGSEGIGIFFLFWTALSMLYLARQR